MTEINIVVRGIITPTFPGVWSCSGLWGSTILNQLHNTNACESKLDIKKSLFTFLSPQANSGVAVSNWPTRFWTNWAPRQNLCSNRGIGWESYHPHSPPYVKYASEYEHDFFFWLLGGASVPKQWPRHVLGSFLWLPVSRGHPGAHRSTAVTTGNNFTFYNFIRVCSQCDLSKFSTALSRSLKLKSDMIFGQIIL